MVSSTGLARRLGLTDAVMIGLGSMIGAGIFAVFAPAAASAGPWLLVGLGIAAVVAFCNATSSAQLAAQYPASGGTYLYGRERLGAWPGFIAGWSFVIGKTASCAAMALTFAAYAAPAGWEKPFAVAAILVLVTVNYFGVTRTAGLTRVIVIVVLSVLALVVIAGLTHPSNTGPFVAVARENEVSWYAVLQSAGLLFFAFAGYARIATMGEEVKSPARTIPRAIILALSLALVIYIVIAGTLLVTIGVDQLANSTQPLSDVVASVGWSWAIPIVGLGAAAASLGALLALIAGIGRTTLAMARNHDVPHWLAHIHPRYKVPHRAEIVLAVVASTLVLTVDLREAIGFSAFGVLLYYFVANIAAFTQTSPHRRYPRAVQVLGALACLVLVATLPIASIIGGLAVVAVGVLYRFGVLAAARRTLRRNY